MSTRKYVFDSQHGPSLQGYMQNVGAHIIEETIIPSPLGGSVKMITVEGLGDHLHGFSWGTMHFVRRLDLFYVPDPPDVFIDTAFCDHIAREYGSMIDQEGNLRNIKKLLSTGLELLPNRDRRQPLILDFGCGIGLTLRAVSELQLNYQVRIIGTDASTKMIAQARQAGMEVLSLEDWFSYPPQSFDSIIASFVLHFGISEKELKAIAVQLRPGGYFIGNYYRASKAQLEHITEQFQQVDMVGKIIPDHNNPILLFRAPFNDNAT